VITCFLRWGYPFLHHTYIYHITRKDHRHNFSPYFYPIYLGYVRTQDASLPTLAASYVGKVLRSPLVSFAPQMLLAIGSGFALGAKPEDLPFTWFVQTAIFVTFNKVCTSQVRSMAGYHRFEAEQRFTSVFYVVYLVSPIGSPSSGSLA